MFPHFLLFFAFIHPGLQAPTASPAPPNMRDDSSFPVRLDQLRDNRRVLLVFAPTDNDSRFLKQVDAFSSAGGEMAERDLMFVAVNTRWENIHWRMRISPMANGHLSPEEAAATRHRFHIAPDTFTVLLLGKDGGEKLRSHAPIPAETLIETIDSMPMRQQEMRCRTTERKSP